MNTFLAQGETRNWSAVIWACALIFQNDNLYFKIVGHFAVGDFGFDLIRLANQRQEETSAFVPSPLRNDLDRQQKDHGFCKGFLVESIILTVRLEIQCRFNCLVSKFLGFRNILRYPKSRKVEKYMH